MNKKWKILGGVGIGILAVAAVPFTGGGSLVVGASALGLGTAVAAGSAVAAGAAGGFLANAIFDREIKVKKGLAILGMSGSGKTTIYDYLQNKKKAGAQTKIEEYDEFEFKIDKKNTIVIRKGNDIGGGTEFIKRFYNKMISDTNIDYCFFVFNTYLYIRDKNYARDVNSRLQFLYDKRIKTKKLSIIGSFEDKFSRGEKLKIQEKIESLTLDKPYATLLSKEYFDFINLTNKQELDKFLKEALTK